MSGLTAVICSSWILCRAGRAANPLLSIKESFMPDPARSTSGVNAITPPPTKKNESLSAGAGDCSFVQDFEGANAAVTNWCAALETSSGQRNSVSLSFLEGSLTSLAVARVLRNRTEGGQRILDEMIANSAKMPLWRDYLDNSYPQEAQAIKENLENTSLELNNIVAAEREMRGQDHLAALTQFYEEKIREIVEQLG